MRRSHLLSILPWVAALQEVGQREPPEPASERDPAEPDYVRDRAAGARGAFGRPANWHEWGTAKKRGHIGPRGTHGNKTSRAMLAHSEGRR